MAGQRLLGDVERLLGESGRLGGGGRGMAAALEGEYHRLSRGEARLERRMSAWAASPSECVFPAIPVFDGNRCQLKEEPRRFLHASRVLGWRRDKAEDAGYLLAQLPLSPENVADFWHMIWEAKCGTVCILLPNEAFPHWPSAAFCYKPFWPLNPGEVGYFGAGFKWTIKCEERVENLEWCSYFLLLKKTPAMAQKPPMPPPAPKAEESLFVRLVHYEAWKRDSEPPQGILRLLGRLHLFKDSANHKNKTKFSPVALLCPTGVHRSGLVAALDSSSRKLLGVRLVDPARTLQLIRGDRYGCLSKSWEYLWLQNQLVQLCLSTDLMNPKHRESLGRSLLPLAASLHPDARSSQFQGPQLTLFY